MQHTFVAMLFVVLACGPLMAQSRGTVPTQTEDLQLVPSRTAEPLLWVGFDGETLILRSTSTTWVYVRDGAGWSEQAALPVPSTGIWTTASAVSGDTLALISNAEPGVHIYVRDGGTWSLQRVVTEADVPSVWHVDLEGDTLVMASPVVGGAVVYERVGTTWSEQDVLFPSGVTSEHQVFRVDLSGDTLAVGVRGIPLLFPPPQPLAAVFVREGTSWSEQASLPGASSTPYLSGDTLLSANRVLVREGTRWSEQAVLVPDQPGVLYPIADTSSLHGDVAVTTSWTDEPFLAVMHVFQRSGTSWSQLARLEASDFTEGVAFGWNNQVVGDTVVTGAGPAAYVFTLDLPECFLVIGDAPGASPFVGGTHAFATQVGPEVLESHAVLLDDIPAFTLPGSSSGLTQQALVRGGAGTASIGADVPAWMADGTFAVQVLMWNPEVFPQQPEQFSAGLLVTVTPDGQVVTEPYGAALGGLDIWAEVGTDADGQAVVRFPFSIEGL